MYFKLEKLIMLKGHMYKGYTAYYIEIIPKKPKRYNIEFTPSNASTGGVCSKNPLIRQIDGYSFYELATGVDDALEQLFDVIYSMKINNCVVVVQDLRYSRTSVRCVPRLEHS